MKNKVVSFVQARMGSTRCRRKNLRKLGEHSIVERSIIKLQSINEIDDVFINTESPEIAEICTSIGATWHKRPQKLAQSDTKMDEWVADFLQNNICSVVVAVNPCVVFLTKETIQEVVLRAKSGLYDTVTTGELIKTHVMINGHGVNFDTNEYLPRTQDLSPVYALNFGATAWRRDFFMENYKKSKSNLLFGSVSIVETNYFESVDIDTEDDFLYAFKMVESGLCK